MRAVLTSACIAIASAAPAPLAAQSASTVAFVIRLGRDTTAVERFTRTGTRLEGETASRIPRTILRRYTYEFTAEGRPATVRASQYRPGGPGDTIPIERATATFRTDSAVVEIRRDTAVQTQRVALPAGVFVPVFQGANASFLAYELIAEMVQRQRPADSMNVAVVAGGQVRTWRAGRLGRDSIWIYDGNNRFLARVDRDGRIESATAVSGTQQFTIERVARLEPAAIAAAWGRGQPVGTLSARDTVRATVAGASLWVDYGRPSKRGRVLFGSTIVPWNQVWRTGANAATQFRTDRALDFGGLVLQPGTYTLWTLPSQAGWKLLINAQTGQWGTAYDPARDIYHLDMRVSTLPQPVERFTISVVPDGAGGMLRLEWDTMRADMPFTVR